MGRILVVGSINMDVVNHVESYPQPGETIKGFGTQYTPGGKGANQAVAASLSGSEVVMIGAVGKDVFGSELISTLKQFDVDTSFVFTKESTSGLAFITVNQAGENSIILNEGANGKLSIQDIEAALPEIGEVSGVLLQNEISWETTKYMIQEAKRLNIHVYFNPAPSLEIPVDTLPLINTLILNETEAEAITGLTVETEQQAKLTAELLVEKGVERVILTLGRKGALCVTKDQFIHMTAFKVVAVDTTAAGDTFIGAFATASEMGQPIENSLRFATAAAALTVTKKGAQLSIPGSTEIKAFIKEQENE
jgi:ribokinase